MEIVIWVKTVE